MARRYDSFVIRCWSLAEGPARIEIEHVQSGRRTEVSSYALAVAWMSGSARGDEAGTGLGHYSDQRRSVEGMG